VSKAGLQKAVGLVEEEEDSVEVDLGTLLGDLAEMTSSDMYSIGLSWLYNAGVSNKCKGLM